MCHFSGHASAVLCRCVFAGHTWLVLIPVLGAARRRASVPWETSVIPGQSRARQQPRFPHENASTSLLAAALSRK